MNNSKDHILDFDETSYNKKAIELWSPFLQKIERIIEISGVFILLAGMCLTIYALSLDGLIGLVFLLFNVIFLIPYLYIHWWKKAVTNVNILNASKQTFRLGVVMVLGSVVALFWLLVGVGVVLIGGSIITYSWGVGDVIEGLFAILIGILVVAIYILQGFFYIRTFYDLRKFIRV